MNTKTAVRKLIIISQITEASNNIADINHKLGDLTLEELIEEKARIHNLYDAKSHELANHLRRIELGELT